MAKVKRVLFNLDFYESGIEKYTKGKHYPVTEQTESCVLAVLAEYVEVDMDGQLAREQEVAAKAKLEEELARTRRAESGELDSIHYHRGVPV
jgi:hypothetical protein